MKRILAIALVTAAGLASAGMTAAQRPQTGHFQPVQYSVPPVPVMDTCLVNGVIYPIDYGYQIWAFNGGGWVVIGRIVVTPTGPVAVRLDGVQFQAVC